MRILFFVLFSTICSVSRFLAGTRKTALCQGFLKLTLLLVGFPARLTRALLSSGGAGLVGGQLRRDAGAGAGEGSQPGACGDVPVLAQGGTRVLVCSTQPHSCQLPHT